MRDAARCVVALALLALLAACGDDGAVQHGMHSETLDGDPHGGAVAVGRDLDDGVRLAWRIEMRSRYRMERTGGEGPRAASGEGSAVLGLQQAFTRTDATAPLRSTIDLRYEEATGEGADAFLARAPLRATLLHDARGRPQPDTLRVTGGTPIEQGEALDMLGALNFAGAGGSPPWLPPRPVRAGEAWALEAFLQPRALGRIAEEVRRAGLEAPRPVFRGTARVAAVRTEGAEVLLDVEVDALISIEGAFHKDGRRGEMAIGDRVKGRATYAAGTGLPLTFEVTHTRSTEVRAEGERAQQAYEETLHGRRVAPEAARPR